MTRLVLLRHGRTAWNAEKRLQGRTDIALSPAGRETLANRRLPAAMADHRCLSSPLSRCLETARLLGLAPVVEARLIEMDWGAFEGRRLDELRRDLGPALAANEARGLDFAPPGGESPRAVQARLAPLLSEIAAAGRPTLAVTHRGVIRALYARAVGWTMVDAPPDALDDGALHVFTLAEDGTPRVGALNVPLEGS